MPSIPFMEEAVMKKYFVLAAFASLSGPMVGVSLCQQPSSVKLLTTVPLAGYTGDLDHMTVDKDRARLIVAAEDHGTVEVFDVNTGAHLKTLVGFTSPHSILAREGAKSVLVVDSVAGKSQILDADTYAVIRDANLPAGADSIIYDSVPNTMYVVTGGKEGKQAKCEIIALDADTAERRGALSIDDDHVEGMAIDKKGNRLFAALSQTSKIGIIDRKKMTMLGSYAVPAKQIMNVTFDDVQHRLFVYARLPETLFVMNSDTGQILQKLPAPTHSDQNIYDKDGARLYVPGGDGKMFIYNTSNPDAVKVAEIVETVKGTKTGTIATKYHKAWLAQSAGQTKSTINILAYQVP